MENESLDYQLDLDIETVKKLLPILFKELQEDYRSLEQAIIEKEKLELKSSIHRLRGLAKNYRFKNLLDVCHLMDELVQLDYFDIDYQKLMELKEPLKESIKFSIHLAAKSYGIEAKTDQLGN